MKYLKQMIKKASYRVAPTIASELEQRRYFKAVALDLKEKAASVGDDLGALR